MLKTTVFRFDIDYFLPKEVFVVELFLNVFPEREGGR